MINQEQYTRESKGYIATIGVDEATKDAKLFIDNDTTDAITGQPVRTVPEEMVIKFDLEGKPSSIQTKWREIQLTNTGKLFTSTAKDVSMLTNAPDMWDFIKMFGPAIQRFMLNGKIRAIDGNNFQPIFDTAGARIADTSYDTTAAPTNNYQTHNVDGTEINPTV